MRMLMTNGPGSAMPEHAGKVFALIGPFDGFGDQADLQDALDKVVREHNVRARDAKA